MVLKIRTGRWQSDAIPHLPAFDGPHTIWWNALSLRIGDPAIFSVVGAERPHAGVKYVIPSAPSPETVSPASDDSEDPTTAGVVRCSACTTELCVIAHLGYY